MPTPPCTNDPAVIEHRLLDLAYTTDALITAPLLAYYAPCRIEDAERLLDRLASESRVRLDVDDDGNVTYGLPNRQRIARPRTTECSGPEAGPLGSVTRGRSGPEAGPLGSVTRGLVAREGYGLDDIRHPPNMGAAAVLSMIVPGAGQLYAGRPLSGVAWFALVTMGYLLLIVPGVLLHILCIASAAGAAHHWRPSLV